MERDGGGRWPERKERATGAGAGLNAVGGEGDGGEEEEEEEDEETGAGADSDDARRHPPPQSGHPLIGGRLFPHPPSVPLPGVLPPPQRPVHRQPSITRLCRILPFIHTRLATTSCPTSVSRDVPIQLPCCAKTCNDPLRKSSKQRELQHYVNMKHTEIVLKHRQHLQHRETARVSLGKRCLSSHRCARQRQYRLGPYRGVNGRPVRRPTTLSTTNAILVATSTKPRTGEVGSGNRQSGRLRRESSRRSLHYADPGRPGTDALLRGVIFLVRRPLVFPGRCIAA